MMTVLFPSLLPADLMVGVGQNQLNALGAGCKDEVLQKSQSHGVDVVHGGHVQYQEEELGETLGGDGEQRVLLR